ncbi:tyrosine-protein phosphatase [Streptomyces sp. x-19]|uniref:tyrosine-protein phosphatase n=1 Tax=Streptomyces sp. x-19 TaxID=2789280 RepID=UPI00397EA3A6
MPLVNFRDVADNAGPRLRPGLLYRSARPTGLTTAELATAAPGLRCVVDLRGPDERTAADWADARLVGTTTLLTTLCSGLNAYLAGRWAAHTGLSRSVLLWATLVMGAMLAVKAVTVDLTAVYLYGAVFGGDADLTPADVAAAPHLHQLPAPPLPAGGGHRRRLDAHPAPEGRAADFSRAFRNAYGTTPKEFRRQSGVPN